MNVHCRTNMVLQCFYMAVKVKRHWTAWQKRKVYGVDFACRENKKDTMGGSVHRKKEKGKDMGKIKKIEQMTQNPFVNLYNLDVEHKDGKTGKYYTASRAKTPEELEICRGEQRPNGVIVYSLCGKKKDKVVLIRQFRYPINNYVYEFPAGLVEQGEDFREAAVREMKEETGLTLHPLQVESLYEKPYYTTVGMTDECCTTVFGYCDGEISGELMEETEEIEVVLADKEEVRRILREERVAVVCAYMLMHFLHDEEPFAFLRDR